MKEFAYFLLQMTTTEDIQAAKTLEVNLRCLRGATGLDDEINKLSKRFPERMNRPWVPSLLAAISPFYVADQDGTNDEYTNPLRAFLDHTMRTLNGGRALWSRKALAFDVGNLSEDSRTAPHMQWCEIFVNRYNALKAAGAEDSHILRLCQVHPIGNITDEQALALSEMYVKDDHIMYMTFPEFIGLYVKSREKFVVENESLQPELAEQTAKTLHVWHQEGKSIDDHLYWLARNYDFHWMHHAFLRTYIAQTLGLTDSSATA
jgi:hypothetical protein